MAKSSNKHLKPIKKRPVNPSALITPLPYPRTKLSPTASSSINKTSRDASSSSDATQQFSDHPLGQLHQLIRERKEKDASRNRNPSSNNEFDSTNLQLPKHQHFITQALYRKLNTSLIKTTLYLFFARVLAEKNKRLSASTIKHFVQLHQTRYLPQKEEHRESSVHLVEDSTCQVLDTYYKRFLLDDVLHALLDYDKQMNVKNGLREARRELLHEDGSANKREASDSSLDFFTTVQPLRFVDENMVQVDNDLKMLQKALNYEWYNKAYLSCIIHDKAHLTAIGMHLQELFSLVYALNRLEEHDALPLAAKFTHELLCSEEVIGFAVVKRKLTNIGSSGNDTAVRSNQESADSFFEQNSLFQDRAQVSRYSEKVIKKHPPDFILDDADEIVDVWYAILAAIYLDHAAVSRPDLRAENGSAAMFRVSAQENISNNFLQFSLFVYTYFLKHFDLIINPYIESAQELYRCLSWYGIDSNLVLKETCSPSVDQVTGESYQKHGVHLIVEQREVCQADSRFRIAIWRDLRDLWKRNMNSLGNRISMKKLSNHLETGLRHPRTYVDTQLQKMGHSRSEDRYESVLETDEYGEELKLFVGRVYMNVSDNHEGDCIGVGKGLNKDDAKKAAYEEARTFLKERFNLPG